MTCNETLNCCHRKKTRNATRELAFRDKTFFGSSETETTPVPIRRHERISHYCRRSLFGDRTARGQLSPHAAQAMKYAVRNTLYLIRGRLVTLFGDLTEHQSLIFLFPLTSESMFVRCGHKEPVIGRMIASHTSQVKVRRR
jgi:hypothetical protein